MKMLYVYADFDWLNETELVGELGYESLRGSDSKDLVDGTTVELYDQVILEGDDLYDGKVVN